MYRYPTRPHTGPLSYARRLCYDHRQINSNFKGCPATDWSRDYEEIAKNEFTARYGLKIQECGLFVSEDLPFLGAKLKDD